MRRDVDAPAVVVDPDAAQRAVDRRLLRGERDGDRRRGGPRGRLGDERRQRLAEPAEDAAQLVGAQAEVVLVEQGVVRAHRVEARGVRARELDVAPQRWHEGAEVARRARGVPRLLSLGGGLRALDGQLVGNPPHPVPVARRTTSRSTSLRPSGDASSSSSHAPISPAVARSWVRRSSVATWWARAGAPPGGIIARWSHAARRASDARSSSSASRARRASSAAMRDTLRWRA